MAGCRGRRQHLVRHHHLSLRTAIPLGDAAGFELLQAKVDTRVLAQRVQEIDLSGHVVP
ncbi:hypothetical protein [Streptomyces sp. NPDC004629]|uniref:hypothetical protein n=1 Tax=Streptomyces sp. NPDC004629 TaxID=3364705 RepID=UPI0036A9DEBC